MFSEDYQWYSRQHCRCPQCGSDNVSQTTMSSMSTGNTRETFRDTVNSAWCSCGWRGVVHDLVPAKFDFPLLDSPFHSFFNDDILERQKDPNGYYQWWSEVDRIRVHDDNRWVQLRHPRKWLGLLPDYTYSLNGASCSLNTVWTYLAGHRVKVCIRVTKNTLTGQMIVTADFLDCEAKGCPVSSQIKSA